MRTLRVEGDEAVVEAMHALDAGRLVAYPGATTYLLGADALDEDAVQHCLDMKGLPADRAVPVLVHDLEAARHVAKLTPVARRLLAGGPVPGLLLVLPAAATAPDALLGGGDTVAVAVAGDGFARDLASRFGPVVATSARRPGAPRPRELGDVRSVFNGAIALGLDGGSLPGTAPTVVDATGSEARVLREGAVPASSLVG